MKTDEKGSAPEISNIPEATKRLCKILVSNTEIGPAAYGKGHELELNQAQIDLLNAEEPKRVKILVPA